MGHVDVSSLPALDAAGEKDDDLIAVPAEVDAVSWPRLQTYLQNTGTHAMMISRISSCQALKDCRHSRSWYGIQCPEPVLERTKAISGQIFANFDHAIGTT